MVSNLYWELDTNFLFVQIIGYLQSVGLCSDFFFKKLFPFSERYVEEKWNYSSDCEYIIVLILFCKLLLIFFYLILSQILGAGSCYIIIISYTINSVYTICI